MNYDPMTFGDDLSQMSTAQYPMDNNDYYPSQNEEMHGGGSPNSSTSSSPQQPGGRARAQSLNTRSPHGRSTAHITQQQINKKRQRATPEQLIVLEEAFLLNPSPNAKMREQISSEISMTERSVQIWFQNRRAKTKLLHRKGGNEENGFQQMPYGVRPGMPMRALTLDQHATEYRGAQHDLASKTVISRLNCRSLTIGSWRRVSCTSMDLVCYFSQNEPKFTYYINSGSSGFKIEFSIGSIGKIDLRYLTSDGPKELGRLSITLVEPPVFFMEAPIAGGWKQCTDFTENQQATKELTHAIVGPYNQLQSSLVELSSIHKSTTNIMTFENLLPAHANGQMANMTFEQPMPTPARSQPLRQGPFNSGFVTPDPRPRMTPSSASTLDIPNQNPRNMHRRTRSRSAPIAVDFSQMIGHGHHGNVSGLPGYSFGQQSLRIDPNYHYNLNAQSTASSTPFDYTDSVIHTPTTAATPNFGQDQWYSASYANTPLMEGQQSTLASPLVQQPSQFDLTTAALQPAYPNGFMTMQQTNGHMLQNHSLPDLQHGAAHMPFDAMQDPQLGGPLTYTNAAPLSIDEMDFGDLQATQAHDPTLNQEQ